MNEVFNKLGWNENSILNKHLSGLPLIPVERSAGQLGARNYPFARYYYDSVSSFTQQVPALYE